MLDVTRFSKCLFAYLYRHYERAPSSDIPEGLPTSLLFRIPSHFFRSLGDCIIEVNRLLRPSLRVLFDKSLLNESCDEETFLKFVTRLCRILPTDHLEMLFLTMCAVVAELNLYFFRKNCFRFANYAPICLATALKNSERLVGTIVYEMDTLCTFHGDGADGYQTLVQYGNTVLDNLRMDPYYVPEAVREMSRTLLSMEVEAIESVNVEYFAPPSSSRSLASNAVLRYASPSTSRTFTPAPETPEDELCRKCKDHNCAKFLDSFEADFRIDY